MKITSRHIDRYLKYSVSKSIVRVITHANFQLYRVHPGGAIYKIWQLATNLEHAYMRTEVNSNWFEISNRFEMSFRLHGNLRGDFTAATFQTMARLYCTYANDIF